MAEIKGKIQKQNGIYGLVGEKLGHSFSPLLHAEFGKYGYDLIEVAKGDIDDFLKRADFSAVNVTIPYKETAMAYCEPDETAAAIGCVNTLVKSDRVRGYNTDTFGFEYMAARAGIGFAGRKVVILGSGGTCRTAAYTASRLGAASITVVSRHPSDIGLSLSCPVSYASYDDDFCDCKILINTTPVGMYPGIESAPIDISNNYVNLEAVIDVVYNPLRTRLVYKAKKMGLKATGGLAMLVAQGYFASVLFAGGSLGEDPVGALSDREKQELERVIALIERRSGNIVLTGMPGSGKTTVGRLLADDLGLEFADTDEMFEADNGQSPEYCIRKYGEGKFRELEKKTVYKAAQSGGKVIATGGGVVLDPENIEMLSLNGTIVYLHRKTGELATGGRPLSEGAENLKALYWKRLPIYLANNDILVDVRGRSETVARDIANSLHNKNHNGRMKNFVNTGDKMCIFVVNGPNLNMLGIREPAIYGSQTYQDLMKKCRDKAEELDVQVRFFQSNHEGELVDIIQSAYGIADAIVINPGAYTHTSVALLDALSTVGIPAVEVHISDVSKREDFRQKSYIRSYVSETIMGHGLDGYTEAMEILAALKRDQTSGRP